MTSLAAFKTAYLATPPVPTGDKEQLAGLVHAVERHVAEGATVAQAVARIPEQRSSPIVHRAQARSGPYQGTLAADFYALDAA